MPSWTSDGEILNGDRFLRRLQPLAPVAPRFAVPGTDGDGWAWTASFLDETAEPWGFAYKDVVQPFAVSAWPALAQFRLLKVRRDVAEVAYAMTKRQWVYPARAATIFAEQPWSLVEGLLRAEAVLAALPGPTVDYELAVLDHEPLERALQSLYPGVELGPVDYIGRGFRRRRRRLLAERRQSRLFGRIRDAVAVVRERLELEEPLEPVAGALA